MKKLILVISLFISVAARADIKPDDVFGAIFGFIQNQINKDNNNNNNNGGWDNSNDNKVILQDVGNKIILGRVFIDENGLDSVQLPPCSQGANKRVSDIRLVISQADVHIDRVKVTFQNGQTQLIDINSDFENGDISAWQHLSGLNPNRCIQKIRITGQVINNWNGGNGNGGWDNSPGNGPGNNNGGWDNGNGNGNGGNIGFGNGSHGTFEFTTNGVGFIGGPGFGGPDNGPGNGPGFGGPGHPGNNGNDISVINIVGLKN